jgi:hydrogenase maturation protease
VGCCAAELLAAELPAASAQVLNCQQLVPEMAQAVSRAKLVIFIDADLQLPAGQVVRWSVGASEDAVKTFPHSLSPQGIVQLARQLFSRAPQAWVYSVGAADFNCGDHLSPKLQKALPKLVRDVAQSVRQFAARTESHHA